MARATVFVLALVAVMGVPTVQRGCRDVRDSFLRPYAPRRDMRNTVAFVPNKGMLQPPDSLGVPVHGRERWNAAAEAAERERLDRAFVNPQAPDDSSLARGERKYGRTCVPCHGTSLKGDGPVTPRFIPPPDLLGQTTRGRSDGFLYAYIRHGGAVMPSYGGIVTAQEAHDVINYIRHMQRTSPR
jgi:mono/diheme cytochrome c family protein